MASLPLVSLSQGELLAIYFAEKVLRQYRGTPFEPDLASAFAKMQELLPDEVKVSPRASTRISPWTWGRSTRPMPQSSARS